MSISNFDPAQYGDGCAEFYDYLYPTIERGLLDVLSALAGGGQVLELGLGTGRVAIPLAASGVVVHGIESSGAMLDVFHAKENSSAVRVIHGDFATARYDTQYRLIFTLTSTFHLLPTLALQASCLAAVAAHLLPDGVFLNEAYAVDADAAAETHDYPLVIAGVPHAYRLTTLSTSCAVMDDLALSAGLVLRERWSDWRRSPVAPHLGRQISVYGLAQPEQPANPVE